MIIDQINLNHLRVFESVYRHKSMTLAAKELFLGQSGISQHIKNLEEVLHITLFNRVKNKLIPTKEAEILYAKCHQTFGELEKTLNDVLKGENVLSGQLTIGVPIEFGNNVIIPLLVEFGKLHPDIRYKLHYGYAAEFNQKLLDGELDIAFVDDFEMDPIIKRKIVYRESLHLCASPEYLEEKNLQIKETKEFFENLEYIKYQDDEEIICHWFKHHFGENRFRGKLRATLMDVVGVSRFIAKGFGAGILPGHMIKRLKDRGVALHVFKGKKNNDQEMINPISICYIEEVTQTKAAKELKMFLIDRLAEKK